MELTNRKLYLPPLEKTTVIAILRRGISELFLHHPFKSTIPILPKLPNHRGFEEFPQWDALMFALTLGRYANAPFVI